VLDPRQSWVVCSGTLLIHQGGPVCLIDHGSLRTTPDCPVPNTDPTRIYQNISQITALAVRDSPRWSGVIRVDTVLGTGWSGVIRAAAVVVQC
jgi:hypothetical protein